MNESQSEFPTYHHTQKTPWYVLLYALAVGFAIAGWCFRAEFSLEATFLGTSFLMVLLGTSLQDLTVEDEGQQLAIHFGPLRLFQKRIWYEDIVAVGKGRLGLNDGWGIHWSPWGGWVWSVRGRDCIHVRLKRGAIRIGTDDPDLLAAFLSRRIAQHLQAPCSHYK